MDTKRSRLQNYIWGLPAIICFFFGNFNTYAKEIDSEYESSLQRALYYIEENQISSSDNKKSKKLGDFGFEKKLNVAKEILEKIEITYENPEFRYYAIRGELHFQLKQFDDAIEYFEKSMLKSTFNDKSDSNEKIEESKLNHKYISKRLYKLYLDTRKLQKGFDFIRLYLATNPGDGNARYESIILASRLGKLDYFEKALKSIIRKKESALKNSITDIESLIKLKKFQEAQDQISQEIIQNPENLKLHSLARISQNSIDPNSDDMEKILLATAAIFYKEKKHSLLLGNFYKKQKRKFRALNLFRRMFFQSLITEGYDFDEEVLYLIRDWYHSESRLSDELAISNLIQMGRRGDHQIEEDLFHAYKTSNNREILVYLIFHLSHKDNKSIYRKYLRILKDHDSKFGDSEFMNIFPVFDYQLNDFVK